MQELFFGKEKVSLLERCPRFRGVLRGGLVLYVASLAQEGACIMGLYQTKTKRSAS